MPFSPYADTSSSFQIIRHSRLPPAAALRFLLRHADLFSSRCISTPIDATYYFDFLFRRCHAIPAFFASRIYTLLHLMMPPPLYYFSSPLRLAEMPLFADTEGLLIVIISSLPPASFH